MYSVNHTMIRCCSALLTLICVAPVIAAEQAAPQQYPWTWWHEAHGHSFWWVIPLLFFVVMIVFCIFMIRRGCMGCMWRDWMIDRPEYPETMKRYRGEQPESAQDILDKRYAKGEIDKQEYEEKKAAIKGSS